jgi:branched-subunit amino acid aminotransferase/4-amino-4-deoxychorismate lyase
LRLPDGTGCVWLDGERVPAGSAFIPVGDPGLQVGLGLFETLAVRDGRVIDLEPHLERMQAGAGVVGIELPPRERLLATIAEAARSAPVPSAWLKILALRSGRWLVLTGSTDTGKEGMAASAIVLPWRRDPRGPLVGVKSTCYASNQLGLELAHRHGADEGLWLNSRGHLAEGCTSNLFVVRHQRVFTPAPKEGDLGIPVHETRVRVKRLRQASEAFLTSSLSALRPLVRLDGRPIGDGVPGPISRAIASRLRSLRQLGSDGDKLSDAT